MKRSVLLALATSLALAWGTGSAQSAPASPRVLRYAFPVAETGFDPAQISDLYSRTVAAAIFDAPLTYAYLARPARAVPNTAVALPEISDDSRRFTFRIRPGIYFHDDPAFQGRPRELVAADYVYAIKRHYDPKFKSPNLFQLENAGILGLSELRRRLIAAKQPFDYDTEVEGLKLLDRYTFQVRIKAPAPRFYYLFTDGAVMGAVAREVVGGLCRHHHGAPGGHRPLRADASGDARRRSCWSATRATARSTTPRIRRPATPRRWRWPRPWPGAACRCSTGWRSASSRSSSRAGWPS
jgi:ABC-type transport system substrate-binding protein